MHYLRVPPISSVRTDRTVWVAGLPPSLSFLSSEGARPRGAQPQPHVAGTHTDRTTSYNPIKKWYGLVRG